MDFVIICNDKSAVTVFLGCPPLTTDVTVARLSYKRQSIIFIKTISIAYGLAGLRYLVFSLPVMLHLALRLLHAGCCSVDSPRP